MRVEARSPRVRVLSDGEALPGVMAADVWSNSHLSADRFRVQFAASTGALERVDQPGVRVTVQAAVDGDWVTLVVGEPDAVVLDPLRGVLDVEGRDLSALLIDSRVDETFANRTSSEIAIDLAGRHGLKVDADRTETLVGRYYQSEHDRVTTGRFSKVTSEWDLLAFLAGREGFGVFMDGEVLRFGRSGGESVMLRPSDCTNVSLEHSGRMMRAIEVTVRSWDQRGAEAVVRTARGGGKGRSWTHTVARPNLPADEAQRLAERTLADLLRHEWTARLSMPGELGITARSRVELAETGTDWDRTYEVSRVSRHIDMRHGFTQQLQLQGAA